MLYFRPIVYADADLRAFKFSASAASSVREGSLCYFAASDLNTMIATVHAGIAAATLPLSGPVPTTTVFDVKKYFPIYREDPNNESVSGTIEAGQFVVGFAMKSGNEFEVHQSLTEKGALASFSVNTYVCLGSNGKYVQLGGNDSTGLVVGRCIGTFGGKYLRVQVI